MRVELRGKLENGKVLMQYKAKRHKATEALPPAKRMKVGVAAVVEVPKCMEYSREHFTDTPISSI